MNNKLKKIILVAFIAIIAGIGFMLYRDWTKPYELPKLEAGLTSEDYNLNFQLEQETDSLKQGMTEKELISKIRDYPDNLVYTTELRLLMAEQSRTQEYIDLLSTMPQIYDIRLQQALAYVDLLQDPDLGTSALGQKSSQSIQILDELLIERPYDVPVHYARGLNNLYWPQGLRRADKAVQDFAFCVSVQQQTGDREFPYWPAIYAALGDALIKQGDVRAGMTAWKEGQALFPQDEALSIRVQANELEAQAIVTRERGISGFQRPDPAISDIRKIWGR